MLYFNLKREKHTQNSDFFAFSKILIIIVIVSEISRKNHLHIREKTIKRNLILSPFWIKTMTQNEKTLGQKVAEMTNKISELSSELGEKFESSKK